MIDLYRKVRSVSGTTERYKRDAIGLFSSFVAARSLGFSWLCAMARAERRRSVEWIGQEFVKRNPEILLKSILEI